MRQELKNIEAQLRKLKKSGVHTSRTAASSRATTPVHDVSPAAIDKALASAAPVPTAGTPYLQSARLVPPPCGGTTGLNKALLAKLHEILGEMNISPHPIPTQKVCDLYDSVRKNILLLLALQKCANQKEGLLQSKRLALGKRTTSTTIVDEETLLGIEPPAAAAKPPSPAPTNVTAAKPPAKAASDATAAVVPSVITTTSSNTPVPAPKATKKAGTTKRKRKSESTKNMSSATAVAAAAAAVVQSTAEEAAAAAEAKPSVKKRTKKS